MGRGFNTLKSGKFFFEAFQHSHLTTLKAEWVLIEFVQILACPDTKAESPHSPSVAVAGHFCPPPNPHFVLLQILISLAQIKLLYFDLTNGWSLRHSPRIKDYNCVGGTGLIGYSLTSSQPSCPACNREQIPGGLTQCHHQLPPSIGTIRPIFNWSFLCPVKVSPSVRESHGSLIVRI